MTSLVGSRTASWRENPRTALRRLETQVGLAPFGRRAQASANSTVTTSEPAASMKVTN